MTLPLHRGHVFFVLWVVAAYEAFDHPTLWLLAVPLWWLWVRYEPRR